MKMIKTFIKWYFKQASSNYVWLPSGMLPILN